MKSAPHLTMRDVARLTGVAVSTVSKALRNDPTIPEKRCRHIQQVARKMGYRPNPLVSALMSQMHGHRRRSDPCHIAWIDLWPRDKRNAVSTSVEPILTGARQRAEELGYGIEIYDANQHRNSPEVLRRLLVARGHTGLIIPPVPEAFQYFSLNMRGLTGITIGSSLLHPPLPRVSPNHFQGAVLAFHQTRKKGFRRLGLALSPAMNDRVEQKWLGAFLACQQSIPPGERVAPFISPPDSPQDLARWWNREKPDAVLVAEKFPWSEGAALTQNRMQLPSLVYLLDSKKDRGIGYLDHQSHHLGRVAIEMVVAKIHRQEGLFPHRMESVLIDSVWVGS